MPRGPRWYVLLEMPLDHHTVADRLAHHTGAGLPGGIVCQCNLSSIRAENLIGRAGSWSQPELFLLSESVAENGVASVSVTTDSRYHWRSKITCTFGRYGKLARIPNKELLQVPCYLYRE